MPGFYKKGNIKVGRTVWTFNKLAGDTIINGCEGSCTGHCTGCWDQPKPSCYVWKSYRVYGKTIIPSHIANTTLMRTDPTSLFNTLNSQLTRARKKPTAIRIHASGELETAGELRNWFNLAIQHPDIPFYIYTKAYEILDEVLSTSSIPSNFYINVSIWHEHGIKTFERWQHLGKNLKAFVYQDAYTYPPLYSEAVQCPAYKGKKLNHDMPCEKCKLCFNKNLQIIKCKEH